MPILDHVGALRRRVETMTLVGVAVIGAALLAFVALASEMIEGDLHAFDTAILLSLRTPGDLSQPIGGSQMETAMRDLTALGGVSVLTLMTVVVLAYLVLRRQRAAALLLGVAIAGGLLLSSLAKTGFSRPRPDLVPHGVEALTASFPSGHSMMAAVTYLSLAVMLARTESRLRIRAFYIGIAVLLTVLVGVSRVYLGVHWPSDVLAGWSLGAAWALAVWLAARLMARGGRIEPEERQSR